MAQRVDDAEADGGSGFASSLHNAFASTDDQYVRLFEPLQTIRPSGGVVGWAALDHSGTCLHVGGVLRELVPQGDRHVQFVKVGR